ncbi:hypothetical protein BH20ACT2_BH20ACT2_21560 [soil metagenome]
MIDAAFSMLQEGRVPPPVDEVAERSGVSVSTIFRYFDGLDDLQHVALARFHERFETLYSIPAIGEGLRRDRIRRFVDARLQLYAAAGAIMAVGRLRAIEHPPLAAAMMEMRRTLRDQVTAQFAPELAGVTPARSADLLAVIDALTSSEAWNVMRHSHGRTRRQIRRAWVLSLETLLRPTAEERHDKEVRP